MALASWQEATVNMSAFTKFLRNFLSDDSRFAFGAFFISLLTNWSTDQPQLISGWHFGHVEQVDTYLSVASLL
jgi:hypothetical protein